MNPERTSNEFIADMKSSGRSWIDILAVARAIRGGRWYDEIKLSLQTSGDMPTDAGVILTMRKAHLAKQPKPDERSRYAATSQKAGAVKQTRIESSDQKG